MDWQEPAALLVVGGTVLLMVVVRIRRFRKRGLKHCSGSCQCPPLEFSGDKPYLGSPSTRTENRS